MDPLGRPNEGSVLGVSSGLGQGHEVGGGGTLQHLSRHRVAQGVVHHAPPSVELDSNVVPRGDVAQGTIHHRAVVCVGEESAEDSPALLAPPELGDGPLCQGSRLADTLWRGHPGFNDVRHTPARHQICLDSLSQR